MVLFLHDVSNDGHVDGMSQYVYSFELGSLVSVMEYRVEKPAAQYHVLRRIDLTTQVGEFFFC